MAEPKSFIGSGSILRLPGSKNYYSLQIPYESETTQYSKTPHNHPIHPPILKRQPIHIRLKSTGIYQNLIFFSFDRIQSQHFSTNIIRRTHFTLAGTCMNIPFSNQFHTFDNRLNRLIYGL